MVDALALGELPPAVVKPWAEGDVPHGESLDLDEYPTVFRGLKKCRSFRADLRHKLGLIVRAHGGHGSAGLKNAAAALRVSRSTLWSWIKWETTPRERLQWERIDNLYSDALEALAKEIVTHKKRALAGPV